MRRAYILTAILLGACAYESQPAPEEWLQADSTHTVVALITAEAAANPAAIPCTPDEVSYQLTSDQSDFDRRAIPKDLNVAGQLIQERRYRGIRQVALIYDHPLVDPYRVWLHEAAHYLLACARWGQDMPLTERADYAHKSDIWIAVNAGEI